MTERNINEAFLEAQKKIKPVKKDATNPYFRSRYATLSAVIDAVKEPLNNEGIAILQPVMGDKVITRLLYEDGTTIEDGGTPIVCKVENDAQAQGSALTYARRQGLVSLLGLPVEDDDAESATSHAPKETKAEPPEARKPSPTPPVQPSPTIDGLISENQRKAIFAICKSKGLTEDQFKTEYKITSIAGLTSRQASEIISSLNSQK